MELVNDGTKHFYGDTPVKVVVIGGGSGSSVVLQGLKRINCDITAVVTMFDSGGSSGILRREFGYPPMGDLRQCLVGLSDEDEANQPLRELLQFRFGSDTSLNGHNLGNLLLAALTTIGKDLENAIEDMARILNIKGRVIPVALDPAELCAMLEDGRQILGESNIDLRRERYPRIERVFLEPSVTANVRAIQAILEADVVVLGPGDLYTSIIPNLLVEGIAEALAVTSATRVYICNLMTKLGETDGFQASDFVREILQYLGGPSLDWALINNEPISETVSNVYSQEYAFPVEVDLHSVKQYVPGVFALSLGNNEIPMKHDASRVAESVIKLAALGRVKEASIQANGVKVSENGNQAVEPIVALPLG